MRIGYCTNLLNSRPEGTGIEFIKKGKEKGFDYVTFVNLLKHIGHEGRISIEPFSKDFDQDAGLSVQLVRQLIRR